MKTLSPFSLPDEFPRIRAWRKTTCDFQATGCHVDMSLDAGDLIGAVQDLFEKGYFLEDITGVDVTEGFLLVYHFDRYDVSRRVILRIIVDRETPTAPSITRIYSGADWHERECFDFFGVIFENHPNLKPLLLPDDLGEHPLVKKDGRRSIHSLIPIQQTVDSRDVALARE
ncbi:MAG: NADH-quinone oxidoreductase subunit C [Desulfatirhabdiaceae bacterium]